MTGKTSFQVPGYDKPIVFGQMSSFAYPIEDLPGIFNLFKILILFKFLSVNYLNHCLKLKLKLKKPFRCMIKTVFDLIVPINLL